MWRLYAGRPRWPLPVGVWKTTLYNLAGSCYRDPVDHPDREGERIAFRLVLKSHTPMLKKVTAQLLRDRLGEHLDRACLSGEAFVITRGERPKAVLLGPTQYLDLLERLSAYENGRKPTPRAKSNKDDLLSPEELKRLIT